MKFMKLGSKPDVFHTGGDNIRYVTSELATDITICVGDVKFYLHKFPLLSKSARLQKLVASANGENNEEIEIHDIPGGPVAFEICAKFCYGMIVTLNAYNVVAARCAAEYLEMYETIEKGNLVYKIEVFLNSSIFRSWKDSIIVLQTTKSLLPWSDELKVVSHCLDSIAIKASIDTSMVEWSYTYNRKKLPSENGKDAHWNGVKTVPRDWWVEDLCELQLDPFKRVITTIKSKGRLSSDIIGEALRAYAFRRLQGFSRGVIQSGDVMKNQALVETIISLLPTDRGSVSCGFLIMLLKTAIVLECGEKGRRRLIKRIGCQLEEATVTDILIKAPEEELCMYDVDLVSCLVEEFLLQEHSSQDDSFVDNELPEIRNQLADALKEAVAKLVDCYLAEISKDPSLPLSKFTDLAEMVSGFSRPSHDGLYHAVDMYLKVHPEITKSERKRICRLMDCRKLSVDACAHAVQNERLPLRVVVQVLFFEQVRATASSSNGSTPPELPGPVQGLLPDGSHGSSRSVATTNTDDHWNAVPTAEELKALKGGITKLGQTIEAGDNDKIIPHEKVTANKMKSIVSKKIFSKMWSGKDRSGENSSSDTSESHASTSVEGTKSTPSRSRR